MTPTAGSPGEVAAAFLRLGLVAFGGPAAHVALMEDEFVRRRRWLTHDQFLDLLGAVNLIPGPNSTELALHLGRLRAGPAGLVAAGVCFVLPSALLVSALAWAYVAFHELPGPARALAAALYGIKPVLIAVILQALARLAPRAARTFPLALLTAAVAALDLGGLDEVLLLFGAGALCAAVRRRAAGLPAPPPAAGVGWGPGGALFAAAAGGPVGLGPLFLVFLKTGAVLFGSGYVLLAFLRADLVERHHWLTEAQLLDAVAVGQVTPGPVSTAATFVGYLLAGPAGALVATAGIFLPGFVFVALSGPLVPRLRRAPRAAAFLDGVNAASLALMAVVTWQLGRAAVVDAETAALAVAAGVLLFRFRVNGVWLMLGGAAAGLAALALRGS